jgi:LCP family protein required for cell wall assembly
LTNQPSTETPPSHSASVAAFLSFIWPGLGQAYERRRRAALVFALPAAIVVGLLLLQAARGLDVLAIELITPTFALTVLVIVLVLGAWRLLSMVEAAMRSGVPTAWRRPRSVLVLVALSVIVLLTHGAAAYYAYSFYDAGHAIFVGNVTPTATPTPSADASGSAFPSDSPSPSSSDNSADFQGPPQETPPTTSSRINILFTGIDSGHGRDHALTDTMLIASIDPATKAVSMVSFPRDISNFKLWDGRTYSGKLNSLMTYALLHPKEFPDGPINTLTKELGYLLGVPIYYYAAINLDGFKQMVDMVGGVTVTYPHDIIDPSYAWEDAAGSHGFVFHAGTHHLDGRTALAFVRSRKADSDFARAARQQILLVALRQELTRPSMLPKIPGLLKAAAQTVRTDFPPDQAADMVSLVRGIDDKSIQKFVLGPPYSTHPPNSTTGGIYTLKLNLAKVAALSIKLFGSDSRYYQAPTPSPSGSATP